jgi:hypothetical protein
MRPAARPFEPSPKAHSVYEKLDLFYCGLHDLISTQDYGGGLYRVTKGLSEIRDEVRR